MLKILLSLVEEKKISRSTLSSADQLTKSLLEQLTKLTAEEWAGYLGEFVPKGYIPKLQVRILDTYLPHKYDLLPFRMFSENVQRFRIPLPSRLLPYTIKCYLLSHSHCPITLPWR